MADNWGKQHEEVTGIGYGEVSVGSPDDPYPAMVTIEIEQGTILADDARSYALMLLAAAEVADQRNDQRNDLQRCPICRELVPDLSGVHDGWCEGHGPDGRALPLDPTARSGSGHYTPGLRGS
jgi:hypothetical protein